MGFYTFSDFFDAIFGSILEAFGSNFASKNMVKINAQIDAEKVLEMTPKLIKHSPKKVHGLMQNYVFSCMDDFVKTMLFVRKNNVFRGSLGG